MARHFGLKTTAVIESPGPIRLTNPMPAVTVQAVPPASLSPDHPMEPDFAAPGLALPFSPASWRGCHGRRSVSAH